MFNKFCGNSRAKSCNCIRLKDGTTSVHDFKWTTPCKKASSCICGQRRPRSACAYAQSDQGLHCPLTIIGYYRTNEWRAKARMIFCACAWSAESVHFAHVWWHFWKFCIFKNICLLAFHSATFPSTYSHNASIKLIFVFLFKHVKRKKYNCFLKGYSESNSFLKA